MRRGIAQNAKSFVVDWVPLGWNSRSAAFCSVSGQITPICHQSALSTKGTIAFWSKQTLNSHLAVVIARGSIQDNFATMAGFASGMPAPS